jgi:hypothetical protein
MRYLLMLLLPALLSAAAPVVSNVRGAQRAGTKLIDITYDLSDSDSATVFVSIQLYDGSTPLPAFSLSGDVGAGVTWRKAGSTTDFANMIIPPDQSIMLQMRSGAKELRQEGIVRANAFRINMKSGVQSAATGFPESLSPVEFGATANILSPPQTTWVGNNQQSLADGIMVFDPSKGSFVTYYMRADGLTWRAAGSTTDLSLSKILKHDAFMMIKRKNSDDKAVVPRPF